MEPSVRAPAGRVEIRMKGMMEKRRHAERKETFRRKEKMHGKGSLIEDLNLKESKCSRLLQRGKIEPGLGAPGTWKKDYNSQQEGSDRNQ